jgi:hypothetical protein
MLIHWLACAFHIIDVAAFGSLSLLRARIASQPIRGAHHHAHDHDDLVRQVPSDPALRIKALESILVEKGLVDPATIEAWIESYWSTSRRQGRGAGLG